jgi:hypothetical protein
MKTKTKTKIVPVKNLRKAIEDGMSFEDAAKHALKALTPKLRCLREDVDVHMPSLLEDLVQYMVESKGHGKFKVEEDRGDEMLSWFVILRDPRFAGDEIWYFPFNMDYAEDCANEDAETLNQFILDFYGIKKRTKPKPTKKEVRAELRRVKAEISEKKSELKNLTSQMNKLSKALKGNA